MWERNGLRKREELCSGLEAKALDLGVTSQNVGAETAIIQGDERE